MEVVGRSGGFSRIPFGRTRERRRKGDRLRSRGTSGAEDLAQEAFLRLLDGRGRYREQGQLRAYLFRIATNLRRSMERRQGRWMALLPRLGGAERGSTAPTQEKELLESELHRQLHRAIGELPLDFRAPLLLYEMEEWSYRQVADALECREGTVKSRIHRARRKLRERLLPYLNGDEP